MHGLSVYVYDLSQENSEDSYLCFWLALLDLVAYFSLYRSSSSTLFTAFDSISFNIDELLINPSANVFVFGDFSVHHKDWLTYSGGTDKPNELMELTDLANFGN